jgi:uncharacterized protein (TIGR02271 family)
MISERDVSAAIGSTAYGNDGESVGTVETFYTDDTTGATTWVAVSSGLLGRKQVIAPAQGTTFADGRLQLAVPADAVSRAPRMSGEHLSPDDEDALRRHYAGGTTTADTGTTDTGPTGTGRTASDDVDVPPTVSGAGSPVAPARAVADHGDGSMVRSEEQLRIGTARFPARRVRVVKYVVTEEVQVTVPVRREEIRIEELPLDDGGTDGELVTEGDALGGGAEWGSSGLPEEIVLHAERPVVTVEVVPVERVRLRTEVVAGQTSVTDTVQREQVTVDEVPALRRD